MKQMKLWVIVATLVCGLSVFTACSSNDIPVNPTPGVDSKIVGNWFSDVSGLTYAKWNYDKTWQNTEFKADGTVITRIYYMLNGKPLGIEKINFTYTASADGALTMTPSDRVTEGRFFRYNKRTVPLLLNVYLCREIQKHFVIVEI